MPVLCTACSVNATCFQYRQNVAPLPICIVCIALIYRFVRGVTVAMFGWLTYDINSAPFCVPPGTNFSGPQLRDAVVRWKGPGADSEEKHEPVSDIDRRVDSSLKALDPERPIREADKGRIEIPQCSSLMALAG